MTLDALANMTVLQLASQLEQKEISPVELTGFFIARAEEERLNAFITIPKSHALQQAEVAEKELAAGDYHGPLHGIPFACKDLFCTEGIRTTGGSRVLENHVPEADALMVKRLKTAGGIMMGKTNLHEFAYGITGVNQFTGTAFNPWDPTRLAGGSSSGSASSIAAGLVPYTLGTDTGGSVRVPAALCGIVGFKPTYGRLDSQGVIPYCWSLDHVGIMAKDVADTALIMTAMDGGKQDFFAGLEASSIKGLRIGVPKSYFLDDLDPEIDTAMKELLQQCEAHGAELIQVELPSMEKTRTASLLVQLPEMLSYHSRYLKTRKHLYGDDLRSGMATGQFILAEHYVRAKRLIEKYRMETTAALQGVDVMLTPTCPIIAPKTETRFVTNNGKKEAVGNALTRFTSFFNMTGHPAISIPLGQHSTGLPMGLQIIGHHYNEERVLNTAHGIEKILDLGLALPGH